MSEIIPEPLPRLRTCVDSGKWRRWKVEKVGIVTAKADEQKTDETKQNVIELAARFDVISKKQF